MSKESKKLAKNILDDKREFPYAVVIALILAGGAIVAFMADKFPTPTIALSDINIAKQIETGLTTPIEETEEDTLQTLLTPPPSPSPLAADDNKLRLHPSASYFCFPENDGETIESLIKKYTSCVKYTNTELSGDWYSILVHDINNNCLSLKPKASAILKAKGMITYIDKINLEMECDNLNQYNVKAELLRQTAEAKAELLK